MYRKYFFYIYLIGFWGSGCQSDRQGSTQVVTGTKAISDDSGDDSGDFIDEEVKVSNCKKTSCKSMKDR